MMRRANGLFSRIASLDNLRLAFLTARRGKQQAPDVREFSFRIDTALQEMCRGLLAGDYPLGRYRQFVIHDPKERLITAPCFPERVLHHAIMNLCEPWFDRWLIDDTFACRKGKGREAAVLRAATYSRRHEWCVHLDLRKYFDNIPHARLSAMLRTRFKDVRLLELFDRIIGSFRGAEGIGLPIGSLTSQHFANFYLGPCDRFIKESLVVPGYVRYMDDLVLWERDRERVGSAVAAVQRFLANTLGLEAKLTSIQKCSRGLTFLGCRILPTHLVLSPRSKKRWRRRVVALQQAERLGLIGERDLQVRLEAATAFATGANVRSWRFRQAVLEQGEVNGP